MIPISQIPNAPNRGAGVTQIRSPRTSSVDTSVPRLPGVDIASAASQFKVPGKSPGIDDSHIRTEAAAGRAMGRAIGDVAQVAGGIHNQIVRAQEQGYMAEKELEFEQLHSEYSLGLSERGDPENYGEDWRKQGELLRASAVEGAPRGVRGELDTYLRRKILQSGNEFDVLGLKEVTGRGTYAGKELARSEYLKGNIEGGEQRLMQMVETGNILLPEALEMVKDLDEELSVQNVHRMIRGSAKETLKLLDEVDENDDYVNFIPDGEGKGGIGNHRPALQRTARREVENEQSDKYLTIVGDTSKGIYPTPEDVDNFVEIGDLTPGQGQALRDRFFGDREPPFNEAVYLSMDNMISQYNAKLDPTGERFTAISGALMEAHIPSLQSGELLERLKAKRDPLYSESELRAISRKEITLQTDEDALTPREALQISVETDRWIQENPKATTTELYDYMHTLRARPIRANNATLMQEGVKPLKGGRGGMRNISPEMRDKINERKPLSATGTNSGGNPVVDPTDLYATIYGKLEVSALNGFVPKDGAAYGITTGSPKEWANFLTGLAKLESDFQTNETGDSGRADIPGGSHGLFQLSKEDGPNYKLTKGDIPLEKLQDPAYNTDLAIAIAATLIRRDGVIAGRNGEAHTGMSAYWGPLRRGVNPLSAFDGMGDLKPSPEPHPNTASAALFP